MSIQFRHAQDIEQFSNDYQMIRQFLIDQQRAEYPFGRWDWMVTHSMLEAEGLDKIGLWLDDGCLVGLATYDTQIDQTFIILDPAFQSLAPEAIAYAKAHLSSGDQCKLLIRDEDAALQKAAWAAGFTATDDRESVAVLSADQVDLSYRLPDGFTIASMAEKMDVVQYEKVLWRGFNREMMGEGTFTPTKEMLEKSIGSFVRPNVDLNIKIGIYSPEGEMVSYCGMWYDPQSHWAVVEPVATDPDFRQMGLARAAIYEGFKRCVAMGARDAIVGSSQAFYYRIGFMPRVTSSNWLSR